VTYWIWENLGTCSITEYTDEGVIIIDVRDLKDGYEDPRKIKHKLLTIGGLLGMGHRVVVRCVAGMSRSNAIAIATIVLMTNWEWDEAEAEVKRKVPRCTICMDFADSVKQAIKIIREHKK